MRQARTPDLADGATTPQQAPLPWPVIVVAVLAVFSIVLMTVVLRAVLTDSDARDDARPTAEDQDRIGATSVATRAVVNWLERNTAKGTRVAAPPALEQQLGAAMKGRAVADYGATGERRVDLVLVSPGDAQDDTVRRLIRRSAAVALFPDGLEIRQVVRGASPAQERAVRRQAGRQLVSDTRLRLTPPAWSTLAAGRVDPRLMGLLAQLTDGHTVDVSGFPRTPAERAARAPALAMKITAIDGALVSDAGQAVQEMRSLLMDHPRPFRPNTVALVTDQEPEVLRVSVRLPRPSGLVPPSPAPSE